MFGVALLTSTLLVLADARIYERCELARDLLSLGISKEHLATWVCIAFHESRFDTAARNPHSGDHGLLQISELYWCGVGKACGLPCSALRDDDISDDVECALRVYEEHTRLQGNGFLAWVVYPHHCKHNAKKYLADCDSSVKTPSVRPAGRARVMKVETHNITNFSYNPKIDELLPPYLAVNSFLRGNYEKEFERNYNNKVRINWLNYKIDNIDDLKLPVFNQKFTEGYTTTTLGTTTTLATTTTTPSPFANIKPPSPRRIESNSFRRRKMRPTFDPAPMKFSESTELPITTTSLLSTISPILVYKPMSEYYVTPESGVQTTFTSVAPTTKTKTTIKPFTNAVELYSSVASDISEVTSETPKLPIPHQSSSTVATRVIENTYTETVDKKKSTVTKISGQYSTIVLKDQKTTSNIMQSKEQEDKISAPPLDDNRNKDSINELQSNISIVLTSTSRPLSTADLNKKSSYTFNEPKSNATPASVKPTSTTTPRSRSKTWPTWSTTRRTTPSSPNPPTYRTRSRTWSSWRTSSAYKSTTESVSPKTSTRTWRTPKYASTRTETFKNISSTKLSSEQTTTLKPSTTTRSWTVAKSLSQSPGSNNNTSSTRNLLVQSTTAKPRASWPAAKSRSTLSPATMRSTSISTMDTSPTTARTTQSIFDLYLNPTKRPKISPFSFQPFKNSGLSLRIFAGGTTTLSTYSSTSEAPNSKIMSGDPAKNQIRRETSQNT